MEELSTLSRFAVNEPYEHSALFGAWPKERIWLRNSDDLDAWYSHYVNHVIFEKTGHNVGPQFKEHRTQSGVSVYECTFGVGRKAWRSIINSGPRASTREALDTVISLLVQIPIDRETNWNEQLSIVLGYKGMQAPVFRNDVSVGMPQIRCTLTWGIAAKKVCRVKSDAFYSRELAFNDALQRAMAIGPVVPPSQATVEATPDWHRMVMREIKGRFHANNLAVRFHNMKPSGRHRCTILWGKDLKSSVESLPTEEKTTAFNDAVRLLKRRLEKDRTPSMVADTEAKNEAELTAAKLLEAAKKRWAVERSFLFQRASPTPNEVVRLNTLSCYLVILDPLRCYELDRAKRAEIIGQLHNELRSIWAGLSTDAQQSRRIDFLRSLVGSAFKESGAPLLLTPKTTDFWRRQGFEIADSINDLLHLRYIRRADNELYTLSPIGSNALEAALTANTNVGAIARALPQPVTAFLVDLKIRLSGNT